MSKKRSPILKLATRLLSVASYQDQQAAASSSASSSSNEQAGSGWQASERHERPDAQVMLRQWLKICRKSSKPFSSSRAS